MKEVISIHIGQAGCQIGNATWELYAGEHNISVDGICRDPETYDNHDENMEAYFMKSCGGSYIPRSLFIDLEPNVIDEVRSGTYRNLFHPDTLINGPEDASNNFARGFFTVGKLVMEPAENQLRRLFERCDSALGFMIYRSLGGGTGSGFTSAFFDCLSEYPKTNRIEVPIYPAPSYSVATVEPYNCLLGQHFCMDDIDIGLLIDNEALNGIAHRHLDISKPTYSTINRLITYVCSNITATTRFGSVLCADFMSLQTNLIPYPRIHFPLISFAPIFNKARSLKENCTTAGIIQMAFHPDLQMVKVDNLMGRYMSCSMFFRGDVTPTQMYKGVENIKNNRSIQFVDWCPTAFKMGICTTGSVTAPNSCIVSAARSMTMLTNNTVVGQCWQRLTSRFSILYSKRSFIHWFVGEGLEESELSEALYNIRMLTKDYEEAGEETVLPNDNENEEVGEYAEEGEAEADAEELNLDEYIEEQEEETEGEEGVSAGKKEESEQKTEEEGNTEKGVEDGPPPTEGEAEADVEEGTVGEAEEEEEEEEEDQ